MSYRPPHPGHPGILKVHFGSSTCLSQATKLQSSPRRRAVSARSEPDFCARAAIVREETLRNRTRPSILGFALGEHWLTATAEHRGASRLRTWTPPAQGSPKGGSLDKQATSGAREPAIVSGIWPDKISETRNQELADLQRGCAANTEKSWPCPRVLPPILLYSMPCSVAALRRSRGGH